MTLEELKKRATASEICLIEAVIKDHGQQEVSRFIKILQDNIFGMTDAWMDRRQAEGIKIAFSAALKEFRQ